MGVDAVAIGTNTTASGEDSFAQGSDSRATALCAVAVGENTFANREAAFAEGLNTTAQGIAAHAEGSGTRATANYSHAEGQTTIASGQGSHAEGQTTEASGTGSHAEGSGTTASNVYAHAEGLSTTSSGTAAHAEGISTTANSAGSHAEGTNTMASGDSAHAQGSNTQALGNFSESAGYYTVAQNNYQSVIGKYNVLSDPANSGSPADDAFIIGNGTGPAARSNAFRVTFAGDVYNGTGLYTDGADYAEMFEWQDGNTAEEDRRGFFVTLEGAYIRKAREDDSYILGVVSAAPSVTGDSAGCNWQGMYVRDEWNAPVYEWVDVQEETTVYDPASDSMQVQVQTVKQKRPKLNPVYDASLPYLPRPKRSEWAAVGMIGKLIVRDDGSCQPNGFCQPNADGVATSSNQGYRVLKRLGANKALICLKGT